MKIRKFKNRRPSLPFRWEGKELQFYERFEEEDVIEKGLDKEGQEVDEIVLHAYKEYTLPWRAEFNQIEIIENDEVVQKDYVIEHFEELFAEAKQI